MEQELFHQRIHIGNLQINCILSSGFFRVDDPWIMPLHAHSTWEMHYIYRGGVDFEVQNTQYHLQAGDLAVVEPYQYHRVQSHTSDMRKSSVLFSLQENKTADAKPDQYSHYTNVFRGLGGFILLKPTEAYYQTLLQGIQNYCAHGCLDQEEFRTVLKLIFMEAGERISKEKNLLPAPQMPFRVEESSENILRRKLAEDFIYKRFQEHITVEDLAQHLHLSVRQTNRFLKENMNITFNEFVREYRIQLARTLLSEYDRELDVVAYEVGYQSYNGFAAGFKKSMGVTPAEYKRTHNRAMK